jgi:multidrug efflux pump subunit AcrA (membrane-fusion protein)
MTYRTLATAILLLTLAACGKKEGEEKTASAEKQDENIVTLTKDQRDHAELKIEPVKIGSLETTLRTAGRVVENANKTAKITSTLDGRVSKLNVDLNDRVKTGDVVGLVETPELLGRPLELKSPIDGAVIERKSTVGELVTKGTAIYTISEPKELWLIAEVRERDIARVYEGEAVRFNVLAYPAELFEGKVGRIGTVVEREARTIEARIEVDNSDGRLKPGMFATVDIVVGRLDGVIVVPSSAIQREADTESVFVSIDADHFEKRIVKTGLKQQASVQILEGLKEGEQIVSEGGFIIKSEMMKGELEED